MEPGFPATRVVSSDVFANVDEATGSGRIESFTMFAIRLSIATSPISKKRLAFECAARLFI
jgi:hypothetical protein